MGLNRDTYHLAQRRWNQSRHAKDLRKRGVPCCNARRSGVCPFCAGQIDEGDLLAKGSKGWIHAGCYEYETNPLLAEADRRREEEREAEFAAIRAEIERMRAAAEGGE